MRAHISNRDYEQLSAYLDGQLAPGERVKLEERLRARPELKEALEDLGRTRALLRMAPRRKAPRNFTLTPAMVGDTGPGRKAKRFSGFNLFPALSFASALAALLLVAVILFDFGPRPAQPTQTAYNPAQPQADVFRAVGEPTQAASTMSQKAADGQDSPPAAAEAAPAASPVPAAGAAPAAEAPSMAAPAAEAPAPSAMANTPPIIVWDMGGRGGGGTGAAAPFPGGMGGGAGDGPFLSGGPGINGVPLDTGPYGGGYYVPPQAMSKSAESPSGAALAAPETGPVLPNPELSGTGPILGVPSASEGGKVIRENAELGFPEQVPANPERETSSAQDNATVQVDGDQAGLRERQVLGVPLLRLLEVLLLVLAIAAGAAAFIVRRRAVR